MLLDPVFVLMFKTVTIDLVEIPEEHIWRVLNNTGEKNQLNYASPHWTGKPCFYYL